jgi:ParB family chromosome partitioning protein
MSKVEEVDLNRVKTSVFKPRSSLDEEKLRELSRSIKKVGLIHAVLLRPREDGFEIVVGERRVRATKMAGQAKIPAIIRDISDREALEIILIENIHREDMSAVDKGRIIKTLMEKFPADYPSLHVIAEKLGVSQKVVSLWLQLVEAPKEIQEIVAPVERAGKELPKGKIDYRTAAQIISKIKEKRRQIEIAKALANNPIPYRYMDKVIKEASLKPKIPVEKLVAEVLELSTQIPFTPEHAKLILEEKKTQTSRKRVDPKIKEGVVVEAYTKFAELKVTKVERKKLGDFNEEDAWREGGYDLSEFKRVWKKLHGEWDDNETVYVVHFKLHKRFF